MTEGGGINVEHLIELCDRIRWDHVNEPRVHAALFADNTRFRQACSAMDMIGDTCQALRAYAEICTGDAADTGNAYLVVFGALQVLYVQQDAVFWLCKSLGYPTAIASKPTPDKWIHAPGNEPLSEVRNLRHSAVGHPVNRDKGLAADRGSYFIVQMSLSTRGFTMNFADDAGQRRWIDVPVFELVRTQISQLEAVLQSTLEEIAMAEQQHRDKFKGQPLEAIFAGLSHPVEKLHEAVRDQTFRSVGMYGVNAVRRAMDMFRAKLGERNEPFGADLDYRYEQLATALPRLTEYYEGRADDRELAGMLAVFVADRIDELRAWAQSKDADYDPQPAADDDIDLSTPGITVTLVPRPPSGEDAT
jgi:hypothetical protein